MPPDRTTDLTCPGCGHVVDIRTESSRLEVDGHTWHLRHWLDHTNPNGDTPMIDIPAGDLDALHEQEARRAAGEATRAALEQQRKNAEHRYALEREAVKADAEQSLAAATTAAAAAAAAEDSAQVRANAARSKLNDFVREHTIRADLLREGVDKAIANHLAGAHADGLPGRFVTLRARLASPMGGGTNLAELALLYALEHTDEFAARLHELVDEPAPAGQQPTSLLSAAEFDTLKAELRADIQTAERDRQEAAERRTAATRELRYLDMTSGATA